MTPALRFPALGNMRASVFIRKFGKLITIDRSSLIAIQSKMLNRDDLYSRKERLKTQCDHHLLIVLSNQHCMRNFIKL